MICRNCGQIIAESEAFCAHCGAATDSAKSPAGSEPDAAPKIPKKKSKKAALLIIPVVTVLAVVIAVAVLYRSIPDTPLKKITDTARNMLSTSDAYRISGSFDTTDGETIAFDACFQTDLANDSVSVGDLCATMTDNSYTVLQNASVCYSEKDNILAGELGFDTSSDTSGYLYNTTLTYYADSTDFPYDGMKMDEEFYHMMKTEIEAVFTVLRILGSDIFRDADEITAIVNRFLQENEIKSIVLKENFASCLKQFLKAASKEDFQTDILGLKVTDENNYQFHIDTKIVCNALCEYFDSAVTIEDCSLSEIFDWLDLPAYIELTIQTDDTMIRQFSLQVPRENDDFAITCSIQKSTKSIAIDTGMIRDKAEAYLPDEEKTAVREDVYLPAAVPAPEEYVSVYEPYSATSREY